MQRHDSCLTSLWSVTFIFNLEIKFLESSIFKINYKMILPLVSLFKILILYPILLILNSSSKFLSESGFLRIIKYILPRAHL